MADSYENDGAGPGGDNPKKRKLDAAPAAAAAAAAAAASGAGDAAAMQAAVLAQMQAMQQKMQAMEKQLEAAKKKAKTAAAAAAAAPQVQNFFLTEDEKRRVQVRTRAEAGSASRPARVKPSTGLPNRACLIGAA